MKIAMLRLSLAVVSLSLALGVNFFAAPLPPVVVESDMRAELTREELIITTPIRNPGGTVKATLALELINSADEKVAEASARITLYPGDNSIPVRLKWNEFAETEATDRLELVLWKRLRYHLKTDATADAEGREITGTRALGEILNGIFSLRVVAPQYQPQGIAAAVRIFAEHPLTRQPVTGVQIEASIDEDENNRGEARQAVTQSDGSVVFDLLPPASINKERNVECKLKITASMGLLTSETDEDITFRRESMAIVTTDKPLYQSGQTLHIRSLVYDGYSHRPLKNESLTLSVKDEDYKTAFERKLTTDRFGVAFADWQIPSTAPLGTYSIRVENTDGSAIGGGNVRVSRYELPTFVVNVEPDKSFYLPDEDARVKVTAAFVFGGQVKTGHIRVAREEERQWNYQEQKWEIKEGGVWEGDADKEGAFTANLPLEEEHQDFKPSDYAKFKDIEYVARYTEAASGRSEERRFKLRLIKEPIHVYAFSTDSRQSPELPLRLFLVANYADGTPAAVDLSITAKSNVDAQPLFTMKTRTDQHGVTLIDKAEVLKGLKELQLTVTAHDSKGAIGSYSESLFISSNDALRLRTTHSLYHQGEPLQVEIQSSVPEIPHLVIEVFAEGRLIRSQAVAVREGHATCSFLPGNDLQGRVNIRAYDTEEGTDYAWSRDRSVTRNVLYPKRRALTVNTKFERDTIKPGEKAQAFFTALSPDGHGRETSLGVVVYDTAVEERERTENESGQGRNYFGSYYGAFYGWWDSLSDVTMSELEQLDDARPFPPDLELAADAILQRLSSNNEYLFLTSRINGSVIRATYKEVLDPLESTIDFVLNKQTPSSYPRNRESLNKLLALHGIEFDKLRDLWGNPYRVKFDVVGKNFNLKITSDGPDEQPNTSDDFTLAEHSRTFWESKYETEITSAIDGFKIRQRRYPNNRDEVMNELRFYHASFLSAKDAWGNPYDLRYEPARHRPVYEVRVVSAGRDGKFDEKKDSDDLIMMATERDWFAEAREKISTALTTHFTARHEFPANQVEFAAVLKESGIDDSSLRDVWGQPLTLWFTESARYNWRTHIERVAATPNTPAVDKTISEPVTQHIRTAWLGVSVPPNLATMFPAGNEPIIFPLASFEQVIREESKDDALKELNVFVAPKPSTRLRKRLIPAGLAGAIAGLVTDSSGAVIANATVILTNSSTNLAMTTHTDDEGYFIFLNLNAGKYTIKVDATGFRSYIIQEVDVRISATTAVDVVLQAGGTTETVTVTASGPAAVQTENASVASGKRKPSLTVEYHANVASTPRLRQDFPETLVWQPSLVTDAQGKAELQFNVADSITTWRLAVIASTEDGLIGSATADLRAFQPFFVEHQPPPSLTVGDEIETPVVVRNFQNRAAKVRVKLAPAPWMQIYGASEPMVRAEANAAATTPIRFKATAAGEFKQEASAGGASDGDRVAKPVFVRFDGRDTFATYADLFQRQSTIDFDLPNGAIQNSAHAELKIYPNLFTHAVEGIEGIVQRPHGCAEQTTSSGYPNLIVLQYLKRTGRPMPAIEKRATENLNEAIARLRSFTASSGGFGYFGGSNADVALTAYVLRFLSEAAEFAAVDEDLIEAAQKFLMHEQHADGSWSSSRYSTSGEETTRLTALDRFSNHCTG